MYKAYYTSMVSTKFTPFIFRSAHVTSVKHMLALYTGGRSLGSASQQQDKCVYYLYICYVICQDTVKT